MGGVGFMENEENQWNTINVPIKWANRPEYRALIRPYPS